LSVAIFKKLLEFCKKLERNVKEKGEGKRRGQRIEAVRVDFQKLFFFHTVRRLCKNVRLSHSTPFPMSIQVI